MTLIASSTKVLYSNCIDISIPDEFARLVAVKLLLKLKDGENGSSQLSGTK